MGLGIMFCMTEVQILQDVQSQILDGAPADPSIQTLLKIFPQSYCAFEVIVLLRIVFFAFFNVICANSLCYEVDEAKLKMYYGQKLVGQQQRLTLCLQGIYNQLSTVEAGKKLNLTAEMQKREYQKMGTENLKDLNEQTKRIKDELTPPSRISWLGTLKSKARSLVPLVIFGGIFVHEILPRLRK